MVSSLNSIFKGTVNVISSDPLYSKSIRFATVHFKYLSGQILFIFFIQSDFSKSNKLDLQQCPLDILFILVFYLKIDNFQLRLLIQSDLADSCSREKKGNDRIVLF